MGGITTQNTYGKNPNKIFNISYIPIRFGIVFSLFFPLFFQLSGQIYHSIKPVPDSGGLILQLPLPISIISCYLGLFFVGRIKRASPLLTVILLLFSSMILTSVIVTNGKIFREPYKILLFLQYILPVCALILGQLIENGMSEKQIIEKAILWVMVIIVPFQLFFSWFSGYLSLTHSMYFFSIYQHYQYVPLMLISGYLLSLFALWEYPNYRKIFSILAPMIGIYAVGCYSMLSLFMIVVGFGTFTVYRFYKYHDKKVIAVFICLFIFTTGYFFLIRTTHEFSEKYGFLQNWKIYENNWKIYNDVNAIIPKNLNQRFTDWNLYSISILQNSKVFFLGHEKPFDRSVTTSAHNYYLDFVYNFGFIAILPILLLIGYTLYLAFKFRCDIIRSERLLGLCMIVFFLVLVDNNFKVTLRQPYPGILTFFLWGVFLSRLQDLKVNKGVIN